jgi:hypothetical protein
MPPRKKKKLLSVSKEYLTAGNDITIKYSIIHA